MHDIMYDQHLTDSLPIFFGFHHGGAGAAGHMMSAEGMSNAIQHKDLLEARTPTTEEYVHVW